MKQVIVLRTDLGMSTGKMIAQACHASLGAFQNASGEQGDSWQQEGATKIAVKVDGEDVLMEKLQEAQRAGIATYLVKDAGRTELAPGTVTALGIGPAENTAVDKITKDLALM